MNEDGVIGKDGKLPWHIPEDLKMFKEITNNCVVIMGRLTYESLPSPLSNRYNVVISSGPIPEELPSNVMYVSSPMEAVIVSSISTDKFGYKDTFIIGGATTYKSLIDYTHDVYLSLVDKKVEGDNLTVVPKDLFSKFKVKSQNNMGKFKLIHMVRYDT